MSDMVERVAAALEPKLRGFGQGDMPMQIARELARVAVLAMLEPAILNASTMHDENLK